MKHSLLIFQEPIPLPMPDILEDALFFPLAQRQHLRNPVPFSHLRKKQFPYLSGSLVCLHVTVSPYSTAYFLFGVYAEMVRENITYVHTNS